MILVLRPQVLVPSRTFVFSLIVPALTNLIMTIDMTIANDAHGFATVRAPPTPCRASRTRADDRAPALHSRSGRLLPPPR